MAITIALVSVAHVVDVKPQHHRVVFVNNVVAVHRVAPHEVAEPEVERDVVILTESYDVLAAALDQRRRVPVAVEHLEFLEMNMDWVRPIKSALELPNFGGVAFDPEANFVAIEKFIVNYPLPVIPVKLKAPRDPLSDACRYLIESRVSCRIYAVVRHWIRNHAELQHLRPLARGENVICRSCTVAVLEAVFEVNDASRRERGEV